MRPLRAGSWPLSVGRIPGLFRPVELPPLLMAIGMPFWKVRMPYSGKGGWLLAGGLYSGVPHSQLVHRRSAAGCSRAEAVRDRSGWTPVGGSRPARRDSAEVATGMGIEELAVRAACTGYRQRARAAGSRGFARLVSRAYTVSPEASSSPTYFRLRPFLMSSPPRVNINAILGGRTIGPSQWPAAFDKIRFKAYGPGDLMMAQWTPMRWPDTWTDPSALDLLHGTAIDYLLIGKE